MQVSLGNMVSFGYSIIELPRRNQVTLHAIENDKKQSSRPTGTMYVDRMHVGYLRGVGT